MDTIYWAPRNSFSSVSWAKLPHTAPHTEHVNYSQLTEKKKPGHSVFILQKRHLKLVANRSSFQQKHGKHISFQSQEIFTVHDLVPLVPVGAFSAVLHSCERRETLVKVNPARAHTVWMSETNNKGAVFTQWSPHRFASGSIQHGLLPGDADFDVNVSHCASI